MACQCQEACFTGIGVFCGFSRADKFFFDVASALDFQTEFGVYGVHFFRALFNAVFQVDIGFFQRLLDLNVTGDVVKAGYKAAAGKRVADHFYDAAITALTGKTVRGTRFQMLQALLDFGFNVFATELTAFCVVAHELFNWRTHNQ